MKKRHPNGRRFFCQTSVTPYKRSMINGRGSAGLAASGRVERCG